MSLELHEWDIHALRNGRRVPTTSHARMPRIQQYQKPWRTGVRAGAREQLNLVSTPLLWHERGIHALLTQRAGDGGITLSRVNTGPAPWRPSGDHWLTISKLIMNDKCLEIKLPMPTVIFRWPSPFRKGLKGLEKWRGFTLRR
jgi:hypothetical protein